MSAITDKYDLLRIDLLGGQDFLGAPVGPEQALADGGSVQTYEHGAIYDLPGVGAWSVHGAIYAKYVASGAQGGFLGYPTSDEDGTGDGTGRMNTFQHGVIIWSPSTGAHEIHGGAWDRFQQTGGFGVVGYPTTDVAVVPEFANVEVSICTNGVLAVPPIDPPQSFFTGAEGALLIVAPNNDFVAVAEEFIAHKRSTGIGTFLHVLTTAETDLGESSAYQLKGYILEAHQRLRVRWVMLLGDASLIPVAYRCTTGIPAGDVADAWYTPTDFYYSDLLEGNVQPAWPAGAGPTWTAPASWDTNGDSRLDEHHWADDALDYNPDRVNPSAAVAVGRVPAHTPEQAAAYLAKVIAYETNEPTGSDQLTVLTDYNYYSQDNHDYLAGTLLYLAQIPRGSARSVGLGWPAAASTPDGLVAGHRWSVPAGAASSRTLVYIGHGGPGLWAVPDNWFNPNTDAATVSRFANTANLPIVLAAGCATSPIKNNAAEDGDYLGVDGLSHHYQLSGADAVHSTQRAPDRIRQGPITTASSPAPITPVRPSPFDFASSPTVGFAAAWLFNRVGGAIAYVGETAVVSDPPGVELIGLTLRSMRRGGTLGDAWTAGLEQYMAAHRSDQNCQTAARIYSTYMHLFGDPSLRLW